MYDVAFFAMHRHWYTLFVDNEVVFRLLATVAAQVGQCALRLSLFLGKFSSLLGVLPSFVVVENLSCDRRAVIIVTLPVRLVLVNDLDALVLFLKHQYFYRYIRVNEISTQNSQIL